MYLQREVDVVGDTNVRVPKRMSLVSEKLYIITYFCLTYRAGTVCLILAFLFNKSFKMISEDSQLIVSLSERVLYVHRTEVFSSR